MLCVCESVCLSVFLSSHLPCLSFSFFLSFFSHLPPCPQERTFSHTGYGPIRIPGGHVGREGGGRINHWASDVLPAENPTFLNSGIVWRGQGLKSQRHKEPTEPVTCVGLGTKWRSLLVSPNNSQSNLHPCPHNKGVLEGGGGMECAGGPGV